MTPVLVSTGNMRYFTFLLCTSKYPGALGSAVKVTNTPNSHGTLPWYTRSAITSSAGVRAASAAIMPDAIWLAVLLASIRLLDKCLVLCPVLTGVCANKARGATIKNTDKRSFFIAATLINGIDQNWIKMAQHTP